MIEETEHQVVSEFGGDVAPQAKKTPAKKPGKKKKAAPLSTTEKAAMALVKEQLVPPPAPEPKSQLPDGHVAPVSTQHYKRLIKDGKITPNAFSKHVPKDEYGYPIVQAREGTADPQAIVGQSNQDEDGVGSI